MNKRKSLGRGLDALLSSAAGSTVARAETPASESGAPAADAALREVPIDLLQRGRYQPRVDMRDDSLAELAESIKAQGVVQPIVVRPLPRQGDGEARYEIVAGERRWRAAQLAGLHAIPAVVRDIPDESAVAVALIENIQRENLNPIEEARALHRLVEEFGLTHEDAASAVGRSRTTVTNLLRLLELPRPVRTFLESRELDMGHARALATLPEDRATLLALQAAEHGWSVRELEEAARRAEATPKGKAKKNAGPRDPNISSLERDLAEKLATRVVIAHARNGRGKLVIHYHSVDELDGILERIR